MKVAINFLVIVALMMTSLAVIAQDTAEPAVPVVNEDSGDEAEILTKDADQLLLELLQQLQKQDLRDPFSPDAAINNEQRKANNEFVEIGPGVSIPEVSLVGVVSIQPPKDDLEGEEALEDEEASEDEEPSKYKVASIRVEGRVYFVREADRVTLTRSSGNLVIQISKIENGFVEVKLGTLAESVIIR
ncbi:MAG: hypothetical protein CMJ79_05275 [Planctomycetaceae bacterium]|nr:hypothetical protein [Planctomycetaceae bacterium]